MRVRAIREVAHSSRVNKLVAIGLASSVLTIVPLVNEATNEIANANVSVTESSTATTLFVSPQEFRILSAGSNSIVMDYSTSIGQPSSWDSETQRIAVEIAITSSISDTATVFRNSGCLVDLSSDANNNVFGTAQSGSVTITGVDASIFVLNDRTPQLTLNGEIDDVLTAIKRVQVQCDSYNALKNKYVRIGAVPSLGDNSCTGNSDSRCGVLYYLFSTQRYYASACSNVNFTTNACGGTGQSVGTFVNTTTGISNLWSRAQNLSVDVDGSARTGGVRRGWVATLATRDEVLLTQALGLQNMIGTTDMGNTFTYNSTAWGGSGANCTASEGNFFWLGPDAWCTRIPARNIDRVGSTTTTDQNRYWRLSGSDWIRSTQADLPANGGIDLTSTTFPSEANWSGTTSGKGFAHYWAGNNAGIAEPNSSGDYIYGGYNAGDGVLGWDDSAPGSTDDANYGAQTAQVRNFYIEFCSPSNPCAAPDIAVASTEILPDQSFTLRKATSKLVDAQVNWTNLPELLFGGTTTTNLVMCISETNTSVTSRSFQLRFSASVLSGVDSQVVVSGETLTLVDDSIFESSSSSEQTLRIEGPSTAMFAIYNGTSGVDTGLTVWIPSGTYFTGQEQIEIRVIARSEIGRRLPISICRQAASDNQWVLTLRPYILEKTIRNGDLVINR